MGALALLTLCGVLGAGLWPFHSPKNQVQWLEHENGLRFGRHGTVLSSGSLPKPDVEDKSCTIEIWVEPVTPWTTGALVSFYSGMPARELTIEQDYTALLLQRMPAKPLQPGQEAKFSIEEVFRKRQLLITVTSDGKDTAVYINGKLAGRSRQFVLSAGDLTGKLIVANAAMRNSGWRGKLLGLAIYESDFSAAQVEKHYREWTIQGKPAVDKSEQALALYLFDERTGKTIHNHMGPNYGLYAPEDYEVVDQIVLETPRSEFESQRGYIKSVFFNIAAFVPLGFFSFAYFSLGRIPRYAGAATVAVGAAASVMIEVLQSYLPTRYSGVTDMLTNTLGTLIGVLLCRAIWPRLARVLSSSHLRHSEPEVAAKW